MRASEHIGPYKILREVGRGDLKPDNVYKRPSVAGFGCPRSRGQDTNEAQVDDLPLPLAELFELDQRLPPIVQRETPLW